jgi:hypothetical protein
MKDINPEDILTPSQVKIFKDREQWMKDFGEEYTKERDRVAAMYDVKERYPTEKDARKVIEMYGGDPTVLELYRRDLIRKRKRTKKNVKSKRKCKCE